MSERHDYRNLVKKHYEVEMLLRDFLSEFGIHPKEIIIFTDEHGHAIATTQDPYGIFTIYPDGIISPEYVPESEESKPSELPQGDKDSQA